MSPLRAHLEQIRRRGWLVVTFLVLAIGATFAASRDEHTTYTASSTLTIGSQNRAPEQDAVLAKGYAEYFNGSYQSTLRGRAGVPDSVTFSARTAASSPIVYVEATAAEPGLADQAAAAMATAFRDDVNKNLRADRDRAIAELKDQIAAQRAKLAVTSGTSPESSLVTSTILALQERIAATESDTANQLRDLQPHAGVSSTSPNVMENLPFAMLGGLILGCAAALGLASLENRLTNTYEVREHLGLDTLVVFPGGKSSSDNHTRTERLKQLANIVNFRDLNRPSVIAVTAPTETASSEWIAQGLAFYRAVQNERTLLIRADLHGTAGTDGDHSGRHMSSPGLADLLGGDRDDLNGLLLPGAHHSMQVLPPGTSSDEPHALFAHDRFTDVIAHAKKVADLLVIQAPPITEAAEAQVICAGADWTILVIEGNATRVPEATEACKMLEQVDASILGAVLTGAHRAARASGAGRLPAPTATQPAPGRRASTEPA